MARRGSTILCLRHAACEDCIGPSRAEGLARGHAFAFGMAAARARAIGGSVVRVALVNPPWRFDGSIYFGCRAPHLPLELAYSKALLEAQGHDVLLLDAHLCNVELQQAVSEIAAFGPELTVVTTAPTYLFWRCAPPELRVPREFLRMLGPAGGQ